MAIIDLPSSDQVMPGSFKLPRITFPAPNKLPVTADPAGVATDWARSFTSLIAAGGVDVSDVFHAESWWRDILCLSWNFHTIHGPEGIASFIEKYPKKWRLKRIDIDASTEFKRPKFASIDLPGEIKCIQSFINVETDVGRGSGMVRLLPNSYGTWKAYTLFTVMRELKTHEEQTRGRRPWRAPTPLTKTLNWSDQRKVEDELKDTEPAVLVIGAGQAGLAVAARLKQLGVRSLVVDRNDRIGDNWRRRYHHLVLHDSVWFDHMPYLNFPATWPVFIPKDKLADWLEYYAKALELTVWTKTIVETTAWDEATKSWNVKLASKNGSASQNRTIKPRHIILATGASGKPHMPDIPGLSTFQGDRLIHSSQFEGFSNQEHHGKGKTVIVIGSCNSGHDIAQDYYEHGYSVTMVQRSSTLVVDSKTLVDVMMTGLYCDDGPSVEDADIVNHSFPWPVLSRFQVDASAKCTSIDDKLLRGLQASGFRLDSGPNRAGLWTKYLSRGGGYYIDTGCSELIIRGAIALKASTVTSIEPHSVRFEDGSELEADEIIFATGYGNMQESADEILGGEVGKQAGPVWGFDEESETRGVWRKGGREGFWYMAGNMALCRFYSLAEALVIKAMEEGLCSWSDP